MIKKSKLPTIIGLVILILATFVGVFLINSRQIFRIGASGESEPNDIRVSNISDASLTISWTTDKESVGFIVWEKGLTPPDEKSYTHLVTLTGLNPNTPYDYKVNSNGILFDNNGISWQAKTAEGPTPSGEPTLVSGSVLTATGDVVKNAIVYINISGNLFSTLTSSSGNFVFQIPGLDPKTSLLEVFVQAGPAGVSSAQIYPQSANPIPPIILGNTHDFKNLPPSSEGQIPGASVNLPQDSSQASKLVVPSSTPTSSEVVTLESIDEGEIVTSVEPEFFGDGPKGATLTITVESESPITDTVNISQNGSWNWTPPEGLAPGAHKITITWKDISGITRSLTRSFVVQAAEGPAFEASQSATTTTPTPTTSATTTPKSSVTPTSTATATSSAAPVPDTGSFTPTFLLSIAGIFVMLLSFYIWKLSGNDY